MQVKSFVGIEIHMSSHIFLFFLFSFEIDGEHLLVVLQVMCSKECKALAHIERRCDDAWHHGNIFVGSFGKSNTAPKERYLCWTSTFLAYCNHPRIMSGGREKYRFCIATYRPHLLYFPSRPGEKLAYFFRLDQNRMFPNDGIRLQCLWLFTPKNYGSSICGTYL